MRNFINFLTSEESQQLIDAEMPSDKLQKVKDLFVFQCSTRLAYKDLKDFNADNIEVVDGKNVYRGKHHKTGKEFTIILSPKAVELLSKYDRKLPSISNMMYNKLLMEVSKAAGLEKNLTSHWARHLGTA